MSGIGFKVTQSKATHNGHMLTFHNESMNVDHHSCMGVLEWTELFLTVSFELFSGTNSQRERTYKHSCNLAR